MSLLSHILLLRNYVEVKAVVVNTLILGSGYLGTQLKKDLGAKALGVSRSGAGDLNLDLSHAESFSKLPRQVKDIVFAVSPNDSSLEAYKKAYHQILTLSIDYAKSIPQLSRFIFISSTGVYGVDDGSWVDETNELEKKEHQKLSLKLKNY